MAILSTYTHIIDPGLKYTHLRFDHEGNLIIKSPKISQAQIEKILINKAKWITRSRERLSKKRGKPLEFTDGEVMYYLGNAYPVSYQQGETKTPSMQYDEERGFKITYSVTDTAILERAVEKFYKQKALELLPPMVDRFSKMTQLFPAKIGFRRAKSHWGSCNAKNAISLNYMMMKLPIKSIEYIILHELAHIRHKHHQKEFWQLVEKHMPDFKNHHNEIKKYH
jgi:predicted metal-dependent hydrolase